MRSIFRGRKKRKSEPTTKVGDTTTRVSSSLQENIDNINEKLCRSQDLVFRSIEFNGKKGVLVFIEPLTDQNQVLKAIIQPLLKVREGKLEEVIIANYLRQTESFDEIIEHLVRGDSILLFSRSEQAFIVGTEATEKRNLTEPDNEAVVRGPHDGLVENIKVNLYNIRHRIQNPNLTVKFFHVGAETRSKLAMLYIRNLAHPDLVKEVEKRINAIRTDTIMSPGFVTEFMEDCPASPFPQALYTERPDRVVSNLMEGRIVMLGEGDPTAVVVPVTLFAFYQTPDDYHSRWMIGSFVRFVRLMSFLIAFLLPSLYIAIVEFHPEVLPISLIYSLKSSIDTIPFPAIIEALLMELTIELIREAGIRLPSRVGQTIGIVGGLVIGDAVVRAGLVSNTMLIVVAITAISSFVVPSHELSTAIRVMRFPLMVAAFSFGFFGIVVGLIIIFMHLVKLESFGTPYLAPFAPLRVKDLKDTFIRLPIWKLNQRPHDPHPQRMKQEEPSRGWKKDEDS
ncbi:spore germination protein [Laceyella sacchari]|uniref:Spore germination protein KA n=1 Tax=Laceyella tengchongensis TaxID=574699 RepID=A0AA45WJ08_9BACL|nr:spore germination protein [Laceyella tengchongensis]AUS08022.1 spore germination protein [Laceyella sacchari]SMP01684.1 spore germination protein KA [Laceyella tengchongensis]